MLQPLLPVFSFVIPLSSCGSPADPAETAATSDALSVGESPFALQFAGTYRNPSPHFGSLESLTFDRSGSYSAQIAGHWLPERGVVRVGPGTTLPLTFHLFGGHEQWSATVQDYDRVLHVERNGASAALPADGVVGPDETLCDESGGMWTDDDVDPRTGLYCVCPPGEVYFPSGGGCLR
jgi:hypothetical protein